MSVIIRLQNLPWSANALDIRTYFRGLSIPDGGVHIVGGENGDAFIAFSTDEDARQAMMLDRGKLKEVQIRLLLSSRAEMQKVIETARQTSLSMIKMSASITAPQQSQNAQKQIKDVPVPQPPVITSTSLKNILSQQTQYSSLNENSMQSYQSYNQSLNENSMDSRDSRDKTLMDSLDYGGRSRQKGRYLKSKSRSRSRERSSRRSISHDRIENRRRRDHSLSRNYDRHDRRRSRSREIKNNSNNHDRTKDRENTNKLETGTLMIIDDDDDDEVEINSQNKSTNIWDISPLSSSKNNLNKGYNTQNLNSTNPSYQSGQSSLGRLQQQGNLQPFEQLSSFPNILQPPPQIQQVLQHNNQPFYQQQNDQGESRIVDFKGFFNTPLHQNAYPLQMPNNSSPIQLDLKDLELVNSYCISSTSGGLPTPSNNIKDFKNAGEATNFAGIFNSNNITDSKQFDANGSKLRGEMDFKYEKSRENQNFNEVKDKKTEKVADINFDEIQGNCIRISNMCPSTNYSELRRFFSGLYIPNNGIKIINDKHGLRIGVAYIRFVRAESKPKAFIRNGSALKSKRIVIESTTDEEFENAVDSFKPPRNYPNRFDRQDQNRMHGRNDDPKSEKLCNDDKPFSALLIEDMPPFAKEQDIIKMFSSYTLFDIILTRGDDSRKQFICYVKFHRAEDAKNALLDTSKHIIGHKQVYISSCSDDEFDKIKSKYDIQDNFIDANNDASNDEKSVQDPTRDSEATDDNNENDVSLGRVQDNRNNNNIIMNSTNINKSNENNDRTSQIPSLFSINPCPPPMTSDPRRRVPRSTRSDDENSKYVLMKNCDYRATKRDFMNFFKEINLTPNRIEILFNKRNQPSGECICEFMNSDEAEKSLLRNNALCGNRTIRMELISPNLVADRLGDDFVKQSCNDMDLLQSQDNSNSFSTNIQNQLMNFLCNQFSNNNSGLQDDFGNRGNSMRNVGEGSIQRGGSDSIGNRNGRRSQRPTRFSDFDNTQQNFRLGNNNNNMPGLIGDSSLDKFGQPGCVVGMENVPYKAGIDDILQFFEKYKVQPNNVIRRYNDDGSPTGDARVAFSSPIEARSALESKRHHKMFNRTIFLNIV